jgi:protein-serine/threonine kinase
MYECLVGYPPFCSDNPQETYMKITNWRQHLYVPDDVHLTRPAEDLLQRYFQLNNSSLLCDAGDRLTGESIKLHPFFRGVSWENLRNFRAPFVPQLKSITDTSYFPVEDMGHVAPLISQNCTDGSFNPNKDLAFVGYTFKRWETLRAEL